MPEKSNLLKVLEISALTVVVAFPIVAMISTIAILQLKDLQLPPDLIEIGM